MRIRCLLGFSTTLSSNMAMKMVYGALNFDSHTLKSKSYVFYHTVTFEWLESFEPIWKCLAVCLNDPVEEQHEAFCRCSVHGCQWELKQPDRCKEISALTCPTPDWSQWPQNLILGKGSKLDGYGHFGSIPWNIDLLHLVSTLMCI